MRYIVAMAVMMADLVGTGRCGDQDSKPGEEALTTVEHRMGQVPVSLSHAPTWKTVDPSAPSRCLSTGLPWRRLGMWRSRARDGLSIRLCAVEKTGLSAAMVADGWLSQAEASGSVAQITVKAGVSSRSQDPIRGRDIEVDLTHLANGDVTKTYVWLRSIIISSTCVGVLYAEDSPLSSEGIKHNDMHMLESHVDAIRNVFDSLRVGAMRKGDSWRRGPEVEMLWGTGLGVRITGPTEWDFRRVSFDGAVVFSDPANSGRDYLVRIRATSAQAALSSARMMVKGTDGRLIADRPLEGLWQGSELVSVSPYQGQVLWHWRRVWEFGSLVVHIVATIPVSRLESVPAPEVMREAEAVFGGVRLSSDSR